MPGARRVRTSELQSGLDDARHHVAEHRVGQLGKDRAKSGGHLGVEGVELGRRTNGFTSLFTSVFPSVFTSVVRHGARMREPERGPPSPVLPQDTSTPPRSGRDDHQSHGCMAPNRPRYPPPPHVTIRSCFVDGHAGRTVAILPPECDHVGGSSSTERTGARAAVTGMALRARRRRSASGHVSQSAGIGASRRRIVPAWKASQPSARAAVLVRGPLRCPACARRSSPRRRSMTGSGAGAPRRSVRRRRSGVMGVVDAAPCVDVAPRAPCAEGASAALVRPALEKRDGVGRTAHTIHSVPPSSRKLRMRSVRRDGPGVQWDPVRCVSLHRRCDVLHDCPGTCEAPRGCRLRAERGGCVGRWQGRKTRWAPATQERLEPSVRWDQPEVAGRATTTTCVPPISAVGPRGAALLHEPTRMQLLGDVAFRTHAAVDALGDRHQRAWARSLGQAAQHRELRCRHGSANAAPVSERRRHLRVPPAPRSA